MLLTFFLQNKQIPQGATIVKLVTTQAGGVASKGGTVLSTQAGATTPNIIGLSSMQPHIRVSLLYHQPFVYE